jgi:hypothetical protein
MTHDHEHHRIALAAVPGLVERPKTQRGPRPSGFFYSTFADWITSYERLKANGITPMSPYYRDPDGNGAELSINNVEKAQWHEKMRKRRLRVAASRPF